MKKINLVIACLLGTAFTLGGYAATPKSEAYRKTPTGNGSESGLAITVTLPDGTTHEMHLFKTWQEMDAYTAKIGFERTQWHMKFDASILQQAKQSVKNAKFDEEGYLVQPYSFDDVGEIGRVMKEKGLPWSVYAFKNGKEWRTIGVVAQDKKYTLFRFSVIDYIDEETYQVYLAAKKAEEEEKRKEIGANIAQGVMAFAETSVKMQAEQKKQEQVNAQRQKQIQEDLERQANEQKQRQAQNQQTNLKNSPDYHANNRAALSSYFNEMSFNKSGNPLNRSYDVSEAELARYEQLIESGVSSSSAAQQVYNEFRK